MLVRFNAGAFRLNVVERFFERPVVSFHSVCYYDARRPTDAHLAMYQDFRAFLSEKIKHELSTMTLIL